MSVFCVHRLHPFSKYERRIVFAMGCMLSVSFAAGGREMRTLMFCKDRYALEMEWYLFSSLNIGFS